MALQEIESGVYEFRATFINCDGEFEVEMWDYHVHDLADAKAKIEKVKNTLMDIRDAKEIKSITYKRSW